MRKAVRAIIIHENKLVVMQRNKFGQVYDTLPGGGVEYGESIEDALYREVQEETCLVFNNPKLVFVEHAGTMYGDQYIYLCQYVSGELRLHPEAEEQHINKLGQNLYSVEWLPLSELHARPFRSPQLQQHMLHALQHGWPETPVEFSWK